MTNFEKIINNKGFTRAEIDRFKRILRDNAIKSIKVLIEEALKKPEYKLTSKQKVSFIQQIIVFVQTFFFRILLQKF